MIHVSDILNENSSTPFHLVSCTVSQAALTIYSFQQHNYRKWTLHVHVGVSFTISSILIIVFCLAVFHEAMREAFQSKVQHPRKAMSLFLKAGKGLLISVT